MKRDSQRLAGIDELKHLCVHGLSPAVSAAVATSIQEFFVHLVRNVDFLRRGHMKRPVTIGLFVVGLWRKSGEKRR